MQRCLGGAKQRPPGETMTMLRASTPDSQMSKAESIGVLVLLLVANVGFWWVAYEFVAWLMGA